MNLRRAAPLPRDAVASRMAAASLGELAHLPGAAQRAFAQARAPRPVLVAVPLYRHPELAEAVVGSLVRCADDLAAIQAEVVLYNDSPDDRALSQALPLLAQEAARAFPCRLETNPQNLGFVKTANRALDEAAARGMDCLLLNSDTVLFPGALPELVRVSRLDPMIGFVNPRSNNATLATLPFQDRFRHLEPEPAHAAWGQLAERLPEMSYTPTAVGFCLLIRWGVLAEFGGFDEIYGAGYNEENDLVMRAGRRGYRAVLANRAFVWHKGSVSFGLGDATSARELDNRAILQARYPEYWGLAQAYFESPGRRAELLLGALIPDAEGRLDVAFDFSSFVPAYNGTFAAGAQLLKAAAEAWGDRFNVYVLCAPDTYAFHGFARFGVERRDPHGPDVFAAVFRMGQPYDWGAVQRLVLKAAVFGVFMLDTISLDCSQLADTRTANLWAFTLEHADVVAATSELTAGQLERRFRFGAETLRVRSLHSLDFDDYRAAGPTPSAKPRLPSTSPVTARTTPGAADATPAIRAAPRPGYVFVVGNHYWHKDAANAANALAAAYPDRDVVVLVGAAEAARTTAERPVDAGRYPPRALDLAPNIIRLQTGGLSPEAMTTLYAQAGVVVFPSHYEGFGIPVLDALAVRRPVFVRPLPVFEEMLSRLGGDPNLHVFTTTEELVRRLAEPPEWVAEGASAGCPGDARRTAEDIGRALDCALERASYPRIVRRVQALQIGHDLAGTLLESPSPEAAPADPAAFIARRVGRAFERAAARLLAVPGLLASLRKLVRAARALSGGRRSAPA